MITRDDINKNAVKIFLSLPLGYTSNERQAFVSNLPRNLIAQIDFEGASAVFFPNLVRLLSDYGKLPDGRYALESLLETAKEFSGENKRKEIDSLLNNLRAFLQQTSDNVADIVHAKTAQVTIILERNIREFTATEQASFVFALSRIVNISPDKIRILHVIDGSVILTLEMPEESATILVSLFLQRNSLLSELLVSKVEIKHSNQTFSQKTNSRDYENSVFVSYAWGGESEHTVNELEKAFSKRGINIVRDKGTLGYKGSIEEFEKRIGRGQCVVLVISDKYLRSEHCMYELVEAEKNQNLRQRIFPIVLSDAKIYRAIDRLGYIKHWDEQIEQLNQAIKQVDVMTNLAGISADLDKYARIRASFDHITDLLSDMNALTPDTHAENDFSVLITAVEHTMKNSK